MKSVRSWALVLALIVGAALAWAASHTPAPQSADASLAGFSALRAMSDDQVIASIPHPTGSAQAAVSRAWILQRMSALGLGPSEAPGEAVERLKWFKTPVVSGAHVENLVGVLKGTDPSAPAVMLMAHSDSVPGSPGAADDAAGVVSVLETVRALEAAGPHRRDVVVAITDGEEAGLLGAHALFAPPAQGGDPLLAPVLAHVGVVLNFEARGGGGRVAMFETGPSNGARMGLFARAVHNSNANSLMSEVYKYMPNSTDFTVAEKAGFTGYNFAFLGEEFDYHSPSSTPAALDKGSLQHMGDQALAAAKALVDAPSLPARAPDAAYSDLLGGPVLAYPASAGWGVLIAAFALVVFAVWRAGRRGERVPPLAILHGAGGALFVTVITGAVLWAAGTLMGAGTFPQGRRLLAQFPLVFGGMGLLTIGAAAVLAGPLRRGNRWTMLGWPETRLANWVGVFAVVAILTLALQALVPPMAMLSAWPLLLGAVTMVLVDVVGRGRWEAPVALSIAVVASVLTIAHLGHLVDQTFTAVGVAMPEILALFVLLALVVVFPLVEGFATASAGRIAAVGAMGVGAATLAYVALHNPASARTPSPVQAFYVQDAAAGKNWRASTLETLDPWSKAALGSGGAQPTKGALPGLADTAWLTPAPHADLPHSDIQTNVAGSRITIRIQPHAGGRELRLALIPSVGASDVTLNGRPAPILARAGETSGVRWSAPQSGVTLAFTAPSPGSLDIRYAEIADGWPTGMAPAPKPADTMPWGLSDTSVVLDHTTAKW